MGSVAGAVFTVDSEGPSYVPGAVVVLNSTRARALQAETDANGTYRFPEVEPGSHKVEVTFPGLHAEQEIVVEAGVVRKLDIELKPIAVTTSVPWCWHETLNART